MKTARNVAIMALIALALTLLPSGGNLATGVLTALSLLFLGAMAMLAVRFWKENSMTRDVMTDRQRGIVYGSLGAIAFAIAGTDEMLATGLGTAAWLVIMGLGAWLIYNTVREVNSI